MIQGNTAPLHPDPERNREMQEAVRTSQQRFERNRSTIVRLAAQSVASFLTRGTHDTGTSETQPTGHRTAA